EPLFYELAENRMPLLGMEKKTGSLEDIFLQLTDKPEEETKQ
ncbi:MAG TPA: ABC transporter, partial [Lachnospiraceae bacterium]|nr:ABC transporter [Lachnospiraceae bacterium]